jgi:acyl-CoA thioesterase FadM
MSSEENCNPVLVHELPMPVRWRDMDIQQHVNNGFCALMWFENDGTSRMARQRSGQVIDLKAFVPVLAHADEGFVPHYVVPTNDCK